MSRIDPTIPPQGNPTTAGVRANFATAKAEIESLQSQASGGEVSIFGAMTAQQILDHRAGNLTFDVGPILQSVATYAASLIGNADTDIGIIVRVPAGKSQIVTQVTMPAKTNLVCDGVLVNNIANSAIPPILFPAGAHCERLLLDANTKTGVVFGTIAVTGNSRIGTVKIKNVDPVAGIGCRFLGYGFQIGSIRVDGGLVGVDLGDGGTNEVRSLRASFIYCFNNATGLRAVKANFSSVDRFVASSCTASGGQIDQSVEFTVASSLLYWDDGVAGASKFSTQPWLIGSISGVNLNHGLIINTKVINTGSTNAASVLNTTNSKFNIDTSKGYALPTGSANPITGAAFLIGANYSPTNDAVVAPLTFGMTAISGTPGGTLLTKDFGGSGASENKYNTFQLQNTGGIFLVGGVDGTQYFADAYNISGPDQSFTTQITPQNINGLAFFVSGINQDWEFEADFDIGDALATTGFKIALSGVGFTAPTIDWSVAVTPDIIAAGNNLFKRSTALATLDFTAATLVGVGQARVRVVGHITTGGTPGSLQIQMSQSTSSATAFTVKKHAIIRAKR